jgi:hypothetical protein
MSCQDLEAGARMKTLVMLHLCQAHSSLCIAKLAVQPKAREKPFMQIAFLNVRLIEAIC